MKKMVAIILTMATVFCLCACGQEGQTVPPMEEDKYISFEQTTESELIETTEASLPSEEEIKTLRSYAQIWLFFNGITSDTEYADKQDALKEYYDQLARLDYSVIDQWKNTEYATGEALGVDNFYIVTYGEIDWDYASYLARVTVVPDVKLTISRTTIDRMGNAECYDDPGDPVWHYNEDGSVASQDYSYYFEISHRFEDDIFCANGNSGGNGNSFAYDESGKLSKITYFDGYGKIDRIRTFIYNEAGQIIQENVKSNNLEFDYFYTYDSDGRPEKISWDGQGKNIGYCYGIDMVYHYDSQGRVVKEEKNLYGYNGAISEKYIMEYTYDSNGKKASATYTAQEWTSNGKGENNHPFVEQIDQHTYVYDQQGRLVTDTIVYGNRYYCDESRYGQEIGKPQFAEAVYEIIYGDYYIYQPMVVKE